MMTNLVGLERRQAETRRVHALDMFKIGEASQLVHGHEVRDAAGQLCRHVAGVFREDFHRFSVLFLLLASLAFAAATLLLIVAPRPQLLVPT